MLAWEPNLPWLITTSLERFKSREICTPMSYRVFGDMICFHSFNNNAAYSTPKAVAHNYIHVFVCLFSLTHVPAVWLGMGWSWWTRLGLAWNCRFDPPLFQISLILLKLGLPESCLHWKSPKKMDKKASPIMVAYFKLLFMLYSQMYHWLKQDAWPRWRSKGRETPSDTVEGG